MRQFFYSFTCISLCTCIFYNYLVEKALIWLWQTFYPNKNDLTKPRSRTHGGFPELGIARSTHKYNNQSENSKIRNCQPITALVSYTWTGCLKLQQAGSSGSIQLYYSLIKILNGWEIRDHWNVIPEIPEVFEVPRVFPETMCFFLTS